MKRTVSFTLALLTIVAALVVAPFNAKAAEYTAFLKYGDGGYWPANNWDPESPLPGTTCTVTGEGTYTLKISMSDIENWGNASNGLSEASIIIYGAGEAFKNYSIENLTVKYDGVEVPVDMTKISSYVDSDNWCIFIYNKYDEWSLANPPYAVDTVTFAETFELSFTLDDGEEEIISSETESVSETETESLVNSETESSSEEESIDKKGDFGSTSTFMLILMGATIVVVGAITKKKMA